MAGNDLKKNGEKKMASVFRSKRLRDNHLVSGFTGIYREIARKRSADNLLGGYNAFIG